MTEGELIQLTTLGRTGYFGKMNILIFCKEKQHIYLVPVAKLVQLSAVRIIEEQNALKEYGMNLGRAFQLADDLLDFTAEKEVLGKAAGADLLEGKLTLPLILL